MNFERNCYVYVVPPGTTEFVTAARFRITQVRTGEPIGEFIYGKNYLARTDAVEIDPIELRLGETRYETARMQGFFGAIRDSMPDFWGRRVIEHNTGEIKLDEFDFLMLGPDDRAGALGFGVGVEPPAPRKQFNKTLQLESLQEIADAIIKNQPYQINDNANTRQVQELLLAGTSMGGARPKAVIEDQNSLWIAKFSSPEDRWNHPRVEHAFLMLAKKCGIKTADSKLISVANKDVLLVRRFDREKLDNNYRRYRMVSALTLLKSDDSLVSRENWSYLSLADEIRRTCANPAEDLRELFSRVCFNAMVSNLDDHPRNHAILAKENSWRLSPAYDLTPTLTIAQDVRLLAMDCGTQGRSARKENLLTGCGRFLLSRDEAEKIINNMIKVVNNEWRNCLRRASISETECELLSQAFIYEGFLFNTL